MEYRLKERSDYTGKLTIKEGNISVGFYTKKQMKKIYPNHNYKVLGEIGDKKGTPDGKTETTDGHQLLVYKTGTHKKIFEKTVGYTAVEAHSYLAVVRNISGTYRLSAAILTAVIALVVALIFILRLNDPKAKMASEVLNAIDTAEQSKVSFMTINSKFTVTQNGKDNVNINQGVFIKDDKTNQVAVAADLKFTSALNPANNYSVSLDIWKKDGKIFENKGSRYEESDVTLSEFNEAIKDYKIYRFSKSEIADIKKTNSIDNSSVMYEITLKKLDDGLVDQYLTSISKQVGEKFNTKNIKKTNAVIVTGVVNGVLKSQQLKFFLELKSVTNAIEMANVSEINVNLDEKTIQNNFLGRNLEK